MSADKTVTKAPAKNDEFLADMNKAVAIPDDITKISRDDAFDLMTNASPLQLKSLSAEVFKMTEQDKPEVFLFTEVTTFKGEQGVVPAIILENKAGEQFICATTMLVSKLSTVTELPAYVRLTYLGKGANAKKQQYDKYNVEVFPSQHAR